MKVPSRIRRGALVSLAGAVLSAVAASVVAVGAPGGAPAGAVGVGWTVGVDVPPVVEAPVVAVGGRVGVLLGRPHAVRVRLVPRVELPAACGAVPEATGPVEAGRYAVELRPTCNGPYRAEVVATGTDLLGRTITSGRPAVRDVSVADPGPAPAPPTGTSGAEGITVSWPRPSDPDIVGWTVVHDGGEPRTAAGTATEVVVPAGAGDHGFRLVARRWGADGPGGPEVPSPASGLTVVGVAPVDLAPPDRPVDEGNGRPGSPASGSEGARAGQVGGVVGGVSASAEPPRRRGGSGRGGTGPTRAGSGAAAPGDPGYRDELPYGERESAAVDEVGPSGEEVAAGAPSVRVSRTSERVGRGLVLPFALSFGLFAAAVLLWSSLRRGRLAAVEETAGAEISG